VLHQIDSLLSRVHSIPENVLLATNAALALFVVVAHGGALLVASSQAAPQLEEIRRLGAFSLPGAALILFASVGGFVHQRLRLSALRFQALLFSVGAAAMFLWALSLLVGELPSENFLWTVGLLSAAVFYACTLLVRFGIPGFPAIASSYRRVPAVALAVALVIDLAVLARALPA
jgi:hypothetical protein